MTLTRWDARVLVRAALVATLALGLGLLLTAATDEGGVGWGERLGRTLPLAPLCAAIGVWGALAPVRARGETLALAALGRTPAQVAAPAIAGGAGVALIAAMLIGAVPAVSVAGFYPTAQHAVQWTWDGEGFVDSVHRLRVEASGAIARTAQEPLEEPPLLVAHGRAAAALATACAAVAMALLLADALLGGERDGATRGRRATAMAAAVAGLAVATTLVLFQASAVKKVAAWTGVLPAAGLLFFAAARHRREGNAS